MYTAHTRRARMKGWTRRGGKFANVFTRRHCHVSRTNSRGHINCQRHKLSQGEFVTEFALPHPHKTLHNYYTFQPPPTRCHIRMCVRVKYIDIHACKALVRRPSRETCGSRTQRCLNARASSLQTRVEHSTAPHPAYSLSHPC
jgi:hypothetical protein